jgi:transcriptional regulator with XRE-family HTH domain
MMNRLLQPEPIPVDPHYSPQLMNLQSLRSALGISQSRLARLSRVSRFRLCMYELGDGSLTPAEQARIEEALRAEAARFQRVLADLELDQLRSAGTAAEAG